MKELKQNPTLKDLQVYIKELGEMKGWDKNSHTERILLFIEEVGELAEAIRNNIGLYSKNTDKEQQKLDLEEEFSDVLSYVIDLANHLDIDLEKAFYNKNKHNETRKWS